MKILQIDFYDVITLVLYEGHGAESPIKKIH